MFEPRTKVIACATVIEEMMPLIRDNVAYEVLDFGLHRVPEDLRASLQKAIDASGTIFDNIILGYGLCSMAVVGLKATNCTLVIPRVDHCIAIFLGSRQAYNEQSSKEPGTYYLTKGWIEAGFTPFKERQDLVERYGQKHADRITQLMLKNYKRLVFIETGQLDQERYREYARNMSKKFDLRYEQVPGSNRLIKKILNGPWDDEFVIASSGQTISFADFKMPATQAGDIEIPINQG